MVLDVLASFTSMFNFSISDTYNNAHNQYRQRDFIFIFLFIFVFISGFFPSL
jgi:membrane protein insertase Oxa1/YidC/SpoIIIJ